MHRIFPYLRVFQSKLMIKFPEISLPRLGMEMETAKTSFGLPLEAKGLIFWRFLLFEKAQNLQESLVDLKTFA